MKVAKQCKHNVKDTGARARPGGVKPEHMCDDKKHASTPLGLNFLIYEMEIIIEMILKDIWNIQRSQPTSTGCLASAHHVFPIMYNALRALNDRKGKTALPLGLLGTFGIFQCLKWLKS